VIEIFALLGIAWCLGSREGGGLAGWVKLYLCSEGDGGGKGGVITMYIHVWLADVRYV
jgi:hypothetical protein